MNLYNLLRILIRGAAQTGGMTKEQTYDALNLIDQLEKVSAFSYMENITKGHHEYKPQWKSLGPYQGKEICGICDKERIDCEQC